MLKLVAHELPLDDSVKLLPYDQREGQVVAVHTGHGHNGAMETLWEPTFAQTRLPAPGSSKMPVERNAGVDRLKKNGRGKALAGLQKEPW